MVLLCLADTAIILFHHEHPKKTGIVLSIQFCEKSTELGPIT